MSDFVNYLTDKGYKMNTNMYADLRNLEKEGTLEWTIHYNKMDTLIKEYKEYKELKHSNKTKEEDDE